MDFDLLKIIFSGLGGAVTVYAAIRADLARLTAHTESNTGRIIRIENKLDK